MLLKFFKSFESFWDTPTPVKKKPKKSPEPKPIKNYQEVMKEEDEMKRLEQEIGQRASALADSLKESP